MKCHLFEFSLDLLVVAVQGGTWPGSFVKYKLVAIHPVNVSVGCLNLLIEVVFI